MRRLGLGGRRGHGPRVWLEGRRRRRRRRLWPRVGYDSGVGCSGKSRVGQVYWDERGWGVLQSKKTNYQAVTKGESRQGIPEWLDGGHWNSCSLALMGSG